MVNFQQQNRLKTRTYLKVQNLKPNDCTVDEGITQNKKTVHGQCHSLLFLLEHHDLNKLKET